MSGLEQVTTGTSKHEAQFSPPRACIAVEGVPTPDGRVLKPYAVNWRPTKAVPLRSARDGELIGYVKVGSANTDGSGEVWANLFFEPGALTGTVGLGVDLLLGETDVADDRLTTTGGHLVAVSVIPVDRVSWSQCTVTVGEST